MLTNDEIDDTCDLAPNEDLFERLVSGEEPLWLWAQTCPEDECPCRNALLVAASSREQALEHASVVRELWLEGDDAEEFAAKLPEGIVAFEIEIDSGEAIMPMSESTPLSEAVARVCRQIDGELLDALSRLWFQGKGHEDLTSIPIEPEALRQFEPGQLLAWDEVYEGARADCYVIGDVLVEAIETYCVRPDCQCNEVRVQFYQHASPAEGDQPDEDDGDAAPDGQHSEQDGGLDDGASPDGEHSEQDCDPDDDASSDEHDLEGVVYLGTANVVLEDPIRLQLKPSEDHADLLKVAFERYQARYPNWGPHLAQRADKMADFGKRLHAYLTRKHSRPWVSSSRKRRKKGH